ncbi:hypothetical protein [Luteolibacter soli]|uniref:Uncharacterized protein n=1 Tax=Luteolibacter soli TaxID=3135280 RepID=A0ABU9AZ11_9BACT
MSSVWQVGTNHSRRAGLTCLLLALLLFGVFQFRTAGSTISLTFTPFTVASYSRDGSANNVEVRPFKGYEIWQEMLNRFSKRRPRPLGESVVASCLATGTLLVIASPFLLGVFGRSRILWWLVFAISVLVAAGITGSVSWCRLFDEASPIPWNNPTGLTPLLLFPLSHLCGMLLIRPAKGAQLS